MCFIRGALWALSSFSWWSAYWAGACTTTATRLASATAPYRMPRLRTPLLREHVRRLKLNPNATARLRGPMLQRVSTN